MPDSQKFDREAFSNRLGVFHIFVELPKDSKEYFRFIVNEFSSCLSFLSSVRGAKLERGVPGSDAPTLDERSLNKMTGSSKSEALFFWLVGWLVQHFSNLFSGLRLLCQNLSDWPKTENIKARCV